ncbi:right-handed parallel beta-helix repeat-containing protein [Formosa algae]|uniref:Right handed beta helix domain-containing protein n=1 Tax=Formosa algae TaxID=225843 RepID=A0A9X0YJQ0_9FLAO|nr:right-handed parallel beta-helix repeat-containing protein [Formosa algae]MBP1840082.1 hypothetical protein [Formosa algae]MDQ0335682.1 hypothetical protein [Formosa algae]OEI80144.1 hypothetical protein AST99_10730 [Formosa algae]
MKTNFKIKSTVLGLLVLMMALGCAETPMPIELYVSVEGDDTANGSLESPFATLPKAVETVREQRKKGNTYPATIYLRGGRHQLKETLDLGVEDGKSISESTWPFEDVGAGNIPLAQLTFKAFPDEEPIISSGVIVEGWKMLTSDHADISEKAKGKIWVAQIPEGIDKFYTLYDEEGRLNRARAEGFVPTKLGDKYTLYFPEGKMKNWDNLEDVEINIRPSRAWMINMLPIASVDEEQGIAKTKVAATYEMGELAHWVHTKDGNSAWVENTLESLDEPGEWVVNSETRQIYLWPRYDAVEGSPQNILVPTTSELIRVEGNIDYEGAVDQPVRGIAFKGITFSHADRRAWTSDVDRLGWGMQHDWDLFDRPSAMLRFRGAEHCVVSHCTFENSGGTGVRFDLHAQRNKIENSEFAHLGEAGILLAGYGPGTKDVNHHNTIVNNNIHHFSEITWHSPGIWAWQSGYNHIANNFLHNSGYAAVLITNRVEPDRELNGEGGRTVRHNEISKEIIANTKEDYESWKAREKYNHSRHNIVEYNEISHAVELLSDGNCIYVSGAGTGNIIRYNYFHDNLEESMPAPIRCDDDQHETLIYGNVLYNNFGFSAGIASKGVNDIINNVIVAPRVVPKSGYLSYEWVPVAGSKVYHNIIVSHPDGGIANNERPRKDQTTNLPNLDDVDINSNLYFNPSDPHWMDAHFERMRAIGKETSSLFADPMFIDVEAGNFEFKEGSPALKLGIEPLDVSKMGLKN